MARTSSRPRTTPRSIRMQGHFLSVLRNPMERVLVMRVGETVFDASLEASAATERLERIRPGSLVSVTGVSWLPGRTAADFSPVSPLGRGCGHRPRRALVDPAAHGRHARDAHTCRGRRRRLGTGVGDEEATAIPGRPERTQPRGTRAARHARAGAGRHRAPARSCRRQPGHVA